MRPQSKQSKLIGLVDRAAVSCGISAALTSEQQLNEMVRRLKAAEAEIVRWQRLRESVRESVKAIVTREKAEATAARAPARKPARLTDPQYDELSRLAHRAQPTYGTSTARVQNGLVRNGLAVYLDDNDRIVDGEWASRCCITTKGSQVHAAEVLRRAGPPRPL